MKVDSFKTVDSLDFKFVKKDQKLDFDLKIKIIKIIRQFYQVIVENLQRINFSKISKDKLLFKHIKRRQKKDDQTTKISHVFTIKTQSLVPPKKENDQTPAINDNFIGEIPSLNQQIELAKNFYIQQCKAYYYTLNFTACQSISILKGCIPLFQDFIENLFKKEKISESQKKFLMDSIQQATLFFEHQEQKFQDNSATSSLNEEELRLQLMESFQFFKNFYDKQLKPLHATLEKKSVEKNELRNLMNTFASLIAEQQKIYQTPSTNAYLNELLNNKIEAQAQLHHLESLS